MKIKRWQLGAQELARYSVIEKTIEGYPKADRATEELPFSSHSTVNGKHLPFHKSHS